MEDLFSRTSDGAAALCWSETVEDLVESGELDKAISHLESIVSNFEKEVEKQESQENDISESSTVSQQLSCVLKERSKLYSIRDSQVKKQSTPNELSESQDLHTDASTAEVDKHGDDKRLSTVNHDGVLQESVVDDDDDWEATADRAPEEFLAPLRETKASESTTTDEISTPYRRRGRGPFIRGLYSDNFPDNHHDVDEAEDIEILTEDIGRRISIHGTNHVLVLAGLPLSTRTTDLERLMEKFKDRFIIRWVNETTSLAVFRTPADASKAFRTTRFPYSVRILTEEDELFSLIPARDLEPPRQRPQTSATTAQRMIAHVMGIRLPSSSGSDEFRRQEVERRNRLASRRNLRDEAWGDDAR